MPTPAPAPADQAPDDLAYVDHVLALLDADAQMARLETAARELTAALAFQTSARAYGATESLMTCAGAATVDGVPVRHYVAGVGMEGFFSFVSETLTRWARNAWSAVVRGARRVLDWVGGAYTRVGQVLGWVKDHPLDAAKTVVTHPYAQFAGAITVAMTVPNLIEKLWDLALSGRPDPQQAAAGLLGSLAIGDKIVKFGRYGSMSLVRHGTRTLERQATIGALGYTKDKLEEPLQKLKGLFAPTGPVVHAAATVKTKVAEATRAVANALPDVRPALWKGLRYAVAGTWFLLRTVLTSALTFCIGVIRSLRPGVQEVRSVAAA